MRKLSIEIGSRIGDWTVTGFNAETGLYECVCKCGKTSQIPGGTLNRGFSKSCRACAMKKLRKPRIDYKGKKIGSITIMEYLTGSKWRCKCDCGKEVVYTTAKLRELTEYSTCGCGIETANIEEKFNHIMYADYTGMKVGDLTVKEKVKQICEDPLWIAECSCGGTTVLSVYDIYYYKRTHCGCKNVREPRGLVGKKAGALKIVSDTGERKTGGYIIYQCECDCGKTVKYSSHDILQHKVRDCGCGCGVK